MLSSIDQTDVLQDIPIKQRPGLRWRIIPGTFLAIFAVMGMTGSALQRSIIVYYNVKYGWIQIDPQNPTLSQLAITPLRILVCLFAEWGVVAAGVSAYAWFYGRWRLALIGTGLFFSLTFMSQRLESLELDRVHNLVSKPDTPT